MEHKTDNFSHGRQTVAIGLSIGIGAVILLALLLSLGLTAVAAPSQTIWYVRPDGSDAGTGSLLLPFGTIQHAVNMATDGDTILVAAGTYTENLSITETLTLRGGYTISGTVWLPPGTLVLPGAEATVINGSGAISQPVVNISAVGVVLDGFTITGGDGVDTGGVRAGVNTIIRNCLIHGNTGANENWGGGGVVGCENSLIIIDSIIRDNQFSGDGAAGGVRTNSGCSLIMINTIVADNHGDPGLDLPGVHTNGDLTMLNVTVAGNDGDIVFNPQPTATLMITNSIVYSHTGISLITCPSGSDCQVNYSDAEGWTGGGTGNISADPLFVDAANSDYHLRTGSPCIDAGTPAGAPAADVEGTPRDDSPDLGAYEWTGFRMFLPFVMRNA